MSSDTSYSGDGYAPIAVRAGRITIKASFTAAGGKMGENKGKGTKGRNYDELSGVGTSSAGITGTTGNLNSGVRDGGIGKPSAGDSGNRAGNRQSAEADDDDTTPALGTGGRSKNSGKQQGNIQGSGLGKSLDQDVMGKEN